MAATAAAPPVGTPSATDAVEQDSNISSPLSEVDDKDANNDDVDMNLNDGDEHDSSMTADGQLEGHHDRSDSDSDLSDAHTDANDTEAETERLYDTPRHQRQRDVVVDQYNEGQIFEHTPSKLRRGANVDEERDDDDEDDESIPDDAASDILDKSDIDESPRKVATTNDSSVDTENLLDSQDRKRKRSMATDNSDPEQPLRKRLGSVGAVDTEAGDVAPPIDGEAAVPKVPSADQSVVDEEDVSAEKQDVSRDVSADETTERETRAGKKIIRNGSKRKGAVEPSTENSIDTPDEGPENDAEDEQEAQRETIEAEVEEEAADIAAKNAEEAERKIAAYKDWSRIEEMFGVFRDRLYKDRLERLEEEEQSLLADEPTHREYLNMRQCLDERFNRKLREIEKETELRMQANQRRAIAIRAQIWSQFAQSIREKREAVLESLNREWYDIQTARRNAHSIGERGLIFPKDPAQRVRNAVAYNTEVSTLAGMAKYEGFPAGPEINGASASELHDDLTAIEMSRRSRQRPSFQPREEYQAPSFNRLGPAGEQFLKDTPWANPNHMAHKANAQHGQPDQVDGQHEHHGTSTAARANHPHQQQQVHPSTAPVDRPLSQQRSPATISRPSESPELTRTPLKAGNPLKRTALPDTRESKTATA